VRRSEGRKAFGVLLAVTFVGCATGQDIESLRVEHENLRQENAELRQRMAALEASLGTLVDRIHQARAELGAQVGEAVNRLGIVESLLRDNEEMLQRFQRRLAESRAAVGGPQPPETLPPGAAGDTAGAPLIPSEIDLYNTALSDYQTGRYDLALGGFREYLRLYPDGTSPDDAQFWIGKIYYDQGQFAEAVVEFEKLLARYPQSDRSPQAMFHLGNAFRGLGDEERARRSFGEVVTRYPNSPEAQLAKRELGQQ